MALFRNNYNKPGPGVAKNSTTNKKAVFAFLELYFEKFRKLLVANLLYVIVALPVITTGLAQAGLAYVTRNFVRRKHVFLPGDFIDTIKKNWQQSLAAGIFEMAVSALLIMDVYFFWQKLSMATGFAIGDILLAGISLFAQGYFY